jgi:hypothetical protein
MRVLFFCLKFTYLQIFKPKHDNSVYFKVSKVFQVTRHPANTDSTFPQLRNLQSKNKLQKICESEMETKPITTCGPHMANYMHVIS